MFILDNKQIVGLAFSLVFSLLVGCSVASLIPGAKAVVISNKRPSNCKIIGPIWSIERNGVSQSYNTKEHLHKDALNRLKNKAVKAGGNTVEITKTNVTYDGDRIDIYEIRGIAYQCK